MQPQIFPQVKKFYLTKWFRSHPPTFGSNIPTHITFPLLQGISTPHTNLIRLCIKKIWMTQKVCTYSLTHWLTDTHTKHAAIRSFLTDDLKMRKWGEDLFFFFFFFLLFTFQNHWNLFWGLPKWEFSTEKKYFTHQEKIQEKWLCPLWNIFLLCPLFFSSR